MRKGRNGGKINGGKKREKKTGEKKREKTDGNSGHYVIAAVDRPNADRWNAARSRQYLKWINPKIIPPKM